MRFGAAPWHIRLLRARHDNFERSNSRKQKCFFLMQVCFWVSRGSMQNPFWSLVLSFDVCVLEQLLGTYGFSARGMTILKGQIPENKSVYFLFKCRCVFGFRAASCKAHFEASIKGGSKNTHFCIIGIIGPAPETRGIGANQSMAAGRREPGRVLRQRLGRRS